MLSKLLIGLIKLYKRFVSPILPPSCRFHPSCSTYGLEAIQRHGAIKGLWLTIHRIVRCNPFNEGGYDPVPRKFVFLKPHKQAQYELAQMVQEKGEGNEQKG